MGIIYDVTFTKDALKQIKKIEKSNRKFEFNRVVKFISELESQPRTGTGNPKHLRHQKEGKEVWSRRVNKGDRFVYNIDEENKKILVTQSLGHYDDK